MEDDKKFDFSCIMPVLNGEKYLKETLESIRKQSIGAKNIQMILIDDGSSDHSLSIMKEYEERFGRVDIIANPTKKGVGYSLNLGIEQIRGTYSFFFGGDDLLSRNTLKEVVKFFKKHDTEMVSVFIKRFGEDNDPMPKEERFSQGNRVIHVDDEYEYPQILNGGCFFKSETIKNRRYNEKLNHFSDGDFMLRYVEDYRRYGVLNTATVYYRIKSEEESLSRKMKNSAYIYTTVMKESLVKLVDYSKERNHGTVSKYMQVAFTQRLSIYLRRTRIQETFTSEERQDWLNSIKFILDEVQEDIILENYLLKFSEKNIMINVKKGHTLSDNHFSYKDGQFYFQDKIVDVPIGDTFKIERDEDEELVYIKVISFFFQKDEIVLKLKRKRPFKMATIKRIKARRKGYYIYGYERFTINGCSLTFERPKSFKKRNIYIYVKGKKIKKEIPRRRI